MKVHLRPALEISVESGLWLCFESRFETTLRSWEGCIDVTSHQNFCVTVLSGWRLPSLMSLYHLVELMGGKYWQFLRIWLLWGHFQLSLNIRKWNLERNQYLMRFPSKLMDKSLKPVWPALQPCSWGFPLPHSGVIIYGQPVKSSKTFCWQWVIQTASSFDSPWGFKYFWVICW